MKRVILTIAQFTLPPLVLAAACVSSLWWPVAGIGLFYVFGCIGVAVTYHRLLAHRAFKAPRWFTLAGSIAAMLGSLLSPIEWVVQHADHHRRVDTWFDPHSPKFLGLFAAVYLMHGEGKPNASAGRIALDHNLMGLHRTFWDVLTLYVAVCFFVAGWRGVVFLWAMPCAMTLWGTIAGIFNHDDRGPRTRGWINALVTCGEQNHARHHADPRDWQGDWPASWIIRLVQKERP